MPRVATEPESLGSRPQKSLALTAMLSKALGRGRGQSRGFQMPALHRWGREIHSTVWQEVDANSVF